ncbi:MAG: HupE/UreJ family protein [Cryomorphaceae bacterium]|nr:HupE/UreJ family protein [Cryomorphaceae bacterium]
MGSFEAYLRLGWDHILDVEGYDHMLFLVALLALYTLKNWKPILILITAFTLGHSVTLILTGLRGPIISGDWVEFLIPITILITVTGNLVLANNKSASKRFYWRYAMAAFFGLIHGMGFSNFFSTLMSPDAEILMPLLAFNVGIELGQIVFVMVLLLVQFLMVTFLRMQLRSWNLVMSGAAGGIALILLMENWP